MAAGNHGERIGRGEQCRPDRSDRGLSGPGNSRDALLLPLCPPFPRGPPIDYKLNLKSSNLTINTAVDRPVGPLALK